MCPEGDRVAREPDYRRLAADLRTRIYDRDLADWPRLPSEADLTASYGMSRITVRKALELLAAEGLVEAVPGKGRVVREHTPVVIELTRRPDQRFTHDAWSAAVASQGRRPDSRVEVALLPAAGRAAALLGLADPGRVMVRRRVRLVDGRTNSVEDVYVPDWAVGTPLATPAHIDADLPAVLDAAGHPVTGWSGDLFPRAPTAEEARALEVDTAVVVIEDTRVYAGADGPVALAVTVTPWYETRLRYHSGT